jgi:hypothetical protein
LQITVQPSNFKSEIRISVKLPFGAVSVTFLKAATKQTFRQALFLREFREFGEFRQYFFENSRHALIRGIRV